MDRSRIGIVIPALNESLAITQVVATAGVHGVPIVVDDGSIDDTAAKARQAGATVVSHEFNRGYDEALNSGFCKAAELDCEVIFTLDADGQHDPMLLREFISRIEQADVVVGVRNRRFRVTEHLFAWFTQLRFGLDDPLCGLKGYRIAVFRDLGHFDSYGSVGTELMLFAARKGYRLEQVRFATRDRQGKSRFGHVLSGNYKILRAMLIWLWRGVYVQR